MPYLWHSSDPFPLLLILVILGAVYGLFVAASVARHRARYLRRLEDAYARLEQPDPAGDEE
jgi:hypothetical protein